MPIGICLEYWKPAEHWSAIESLGVTPVALDGTDFYSSEKISCANCLVAHHADGRTLFSHKAVTPVIVAPNVRQAVPLRPEFCAPQDGVAETGL